MSALLLKINLWRRLAGALETDLAGGCPGDDGACGVREGDDGVVER